VGLDVHRAARIAAVARGGQVVLSEATSAIAKDALPEGAVLTDLGMHRLEDLGHPERLFQLTGPGLAAEFPPLRSLGNPALLNNLPAELTPIIGRDHELDEVRALVRSSRLVTITGAGGAGKTRLGLHIAEMLDGSGDGVWLVELVAVTSEDAVGRRSARPCGCLRSRGARRWTFCLKSPGQLTDVTPWLVAASELVAWVTSATDAAT
jgi:hypothetical protein